MCTELSVFCFRLEDVEHETVEIRADLQREQSVSATECAAFYMYMLCFILHVHVHAVLNSTCTCTCRSQFCYHSSLVAWLADGLGPLEGVCVYRIVCFLFQVRGRGT